MQILSSLLFACSVNIDVFIVAMSFGIKKAKIRFVQNMLISLISFLGTLFSIFGGQCILEIISPVWAQYIGAVTLFTLGLLYITKGLYSQEESPKNTTPLFTFKETFSLGIALSLNNIGIGIGAGISGANVWMSSACSFFVSLLFLFTGNRLGSSSFFNFSAKYADCICGMLLVILAVHNYFKLVTPF